MQRDDMGVSGGVSSGSSEGRKSGGGGGLTLGYCAPVLLGGWNVPWWQGVRDWRGRSILAEILRPSGGEMAVG